MRACLLGVFIVLIFAAFTTSCAATVEPPLVSLGRTPLDMPYFERVMSSDANVLRLGPPEFRQFNDSLREVVVEMDRRFHAKDASPEVRKRLVMLLARLLYSEEVAHPWQTLDWRVGLKGFAPLLRDMMDHSAWAEAVLLCAMQVEVDGTSLIQYPEIKRVVLARLRRASREVLPQYGRALLHTEVEPGERAEIWPALEAAFYEADPSYREDGEPALIPGLDPRISGREMIGGTIALAQRWQRTDLIDLCLHVLTEERLSNCRFEAGHAFAESVPDSPKARKLVRLILEQHVNVPFQAAMEFIARNKIAREYEQELRAMAAHYNRWFHDPAREVLAESGLQLPDIAPTRLEPENAAALHKLHNLALMLGPDAKRCVAGVLHRDGWSRRSYGLERGWARPLEGGRVEFLSDRGALKRATPAELDLQYTDYELEIRQALERLAKLKDLPSTGAAGRRDYYWYNGYLDTYGDEPTAEVQRMLTLLGRESDPADPQAPEIALFLDALIPSGWTTEREMTQWIIGQTVVSLHGEMVAAFCTGDDEVAQEYTRRLLAVRDLADRVNVSDYVIAQAVAVQVEIAACAKPLKVPDDSVKGMFERIRRRPNLGSLASFYSYQPDLSNSEDKDIAAIIAAGAPALKTLFKLLDDERPVREQRGDTLQSSSWLAFNLIQAIVWKERSQSVGDPYLETGKRKEFAEFLENLFPGFQSD